MEPVTLETPRLLMRPFTDADSPAVHRACQDPDIQRWTTVPVPYLPSSAETFVREICPAGWRDENLFTLGVFTRDGGELVSSMSVFARNWPKDSILEIGYWTAKEQRGHGYTVESATALCRWAFAVLGVQRIEWLALAGNHASQAVAVRTGFVIEGTLRSRLVHRGERCDAWIGSLLPSDLA